MRPSRRCRRAAGGRTHPGPGARPARRPRPTRSTISRMSALPERPSRPERCSSASASSPADSSLVLLQPQQQSGIDAAGAGGHHQALQRREAHRGVERGPVLDRAQRSAGPEVAADDPQPRSVPLQQLGCAPRDPRVREAVKAVAAQTPALAPLCRQRVGARRLRAGWRGTRCQSMRRRAGPVAPR